MMSNLRTGLGRFTTLTLLVAMMLIVIIAITIFMAFFAYSETAEQAGCLVVHQFD